MPYCRHVVEAVPSARSRVGLLVALLFSFPSFLSAQTQGVVRGRVVEERTGAAVVGAQVFVPNTNIGAITGAEGRYELLQPPGTHTLRVSRVGYASQQRAVTVAAGQTITWDVALAPAALNLEELVVTGTPQATQRRVLGNAVTRIDAARIVDENSISNVAELLQAKAPGLTILLNAGTPGAAPDIRMRGTGSFFGNRPVIYVDGVRYNSDDLGNFTPAGAGVSAQAGQGTSALSLINPEDIESIEVIKGPAAATLYGADAATGVIQIITKRGARGRQATRWTARLETGRTDWNLTIPDNYTLCDSAKIAQPQT